MVLPGSHTNDWRKTRLFGPIVAMTLGGLVLLVALSFFLVERFDRVASNREVAMVRHGFARQVEELDTVIATQVDWDDAVLNLDRNFSPEWADFNVGNYLHTFNGFSHAFVVDSGNRAIYASVDGERAAIENFAPFAATTAKLVPQIRLAERKRPALGPRPGKNNIAVPAIQANTVARIGGEAYLVTATLVQPDFGKILPKQPQAPITITALPLNQAFLDAFAGRYMLDGLRLGDRVLPSKNERHVALQGSQGEPAAIFAWTPRQPGTMILNELRWPALAALLLLGLIALTVVRRGSNIVKELIQSERRARHLAFHDTLTGLPNRAMLFARLNGMLADCGKPDCGVTVICVDLDHFKQVNDTLGHHAGDLLIETVARRLEENGGEAELIARLGGDEFVLLYDYADAKRAQLQSERILAALKHPLETEYGKIEVACSIGIAVVIEPGLDPSEVLRWGDLALYRSKELGRSQANFFEPHMDEALLARRALEADLRHALAEDGLTMVYQPQVNRHGEVHAVESLLRWHLPDGSTVPPARFVALAEECGLILPLGEFVMRRVFEETRDWQNVRIAINVSPVQIRSPGFAAQVVQMAARAGVDPAHYEIELTETALLGDDRVTSGNIEALQRIGFSIALGDFGTGHSSLSVLQRFSVNRIKIDRSFVGNMVASAEAEALIDAMVKLARALGVSVIAEGVETEAQLSRLIECGCREFQGHLIGMPQPKAAIEARLGIAPALESTAFKLRA